LIRVDKLDLSRVPSGVHRFRVETVPNATGEIMTVPVLVKKGKKSGPIVGFTAAVHGNELNGLHVIHRLFDEISDETLNGTVVAVPVCNLPGFLNNQREFSDGQDLNRCFPGKHKGTPSDVYAYSLMENVISQFDYLIDLHTASAGRINSLYVRADLKNPETKKMASFQHAQIYVHNAGGDGTLRAAACERGIPAITLEIGDPSRIQRSLVARTLDGVLEYLSALSMLNFNSTEPSEEPVICDRSYWIFTDVGGVLQVLPDLTQRIKQGDCIAIQKNLFGDLIKRYFAPEDGIVIGKNVNPAASAGARLLHLGIPND